MKKLLAFGLFLFLPLFAWAVPTSQEITLSADQMAQIKAWAEPASNTSDPTRWVVVEALDPACSDCRAAEPNFRRMEMAGKLQRFTILNPVLGDKSERLGAVILAAGEQGKAEAMRRDIMGYTQGLVSKDVILGFAREQGLDRKRLRGDINSDNIRAEVKKRQDFMRGLGVTQAPASFIISRKEWELTGRPVKATLVFGDPSGLEFSKAIQ